MEGLPQYAEYTQKSYKPVIKREHKIEILQRICKSGSQKRKPKLSIIEFLAQIYLYEITVLIKISFLFGVILNILSLIKAIRDNL